MSEVGSADAAGRLRGRMHGRLHLGIDLGTQSVKASLVDDAGTVCAAASAPLQSIRTGDRHEQRPEEWVAATRRATADAVRTLARGERRRIAGVAVCATSGTFTTVDAAGRPASAGIMYDDLRAAGLTADATAAGETLWARLGYRIQPTWALPKVAWAAREGMLSPDRRIAHQGDVVAAAMVGTRVATDWSQALKTGYDTLDLTWPAGVLDTLGIDADRLPGVVAPGTRLGAVTTDWAESTGVPEGTAVFAGMTDGCAAQLGAAASGLGDWHSVLGTTLVMKGVADRIVADDTGAVYSHRSPEPGRWLPGGASNAGAGVLSRLLPAADLDALTAEAAAVPLTDLPFAYPLAGRGERFPFVHPDARGFLVDGGVPRPLTPTAAPPDRLLAAVLLGLALVERLAVETMAASGIAVDGRFSTSGGGTRNGWWNQLRADALGRPLAIPASAEGAAGMAILAAWAHGAGAQGDGAQGDDPLSRVAARMSHVAEVVEPSSGARRAALDDVYGRFVAVLTEKGWLSG